jgi:hypothetical protein
VRLGALPALTAAEEQQTPSVVDRTFAGSRRDDGARYRNRPDISRIQSESRSS